jgi:hypothetical protein
MLDIEKLKDSNHITTKEETININITSLSYKPRKIIVKKYSKYMNPTMGAEMMTSINKLETIKEGKDENNSISSVKTFPKGDTINVHRTNKKDRITNDILADLPKTRRNKYGIRNSIKGFAKYSRKVWNSISNIMNVSHNQKI